MSNGQSNIAKFRVVIQRLALEKLKGSLPMCVGNAIHDGVTKSSFANRIPLTMPSSASNLTQNLPFLPWHYLYNGDHAASPQKGSSLWGAFEKPTSVLRERSISTKMPLGRKYGLGRVPRHLPKFSLERAYPNLHETFHLTVGKAVNFLQSPGDRTRVPFPGLSSSSTGADAGGWGRRPRPGRRRAGGTPFEDRWDDIRKSLAVLGRVSAGNRVVLFRESDVAFERMWEAVDGAAREVLWQTYICKDDEVGSRTLRRMVTARLRNCRVELLYDSGGNISGRTRLTEELKNCGGSVIAYRPFFSSALKYFLQGLDWRKSPGLRNHRKILLVDNEIGFCGGLNIGNEYCGLRLGGNNKFRDAHCAVYGPVVAHLREVYDDTKAPQTWKYGWARWRQIASNKLNRRIEVGKNAVETGILRPIQDGTRKATERGGIYFRQQVHKAERSTERMLRRIRWEKQWEKISKWVTWYNKRVSTLLNRMSDTTIPESPQKYEGSSGAHETQSKAESLSSSKLEGVQPDFILGENSRVDIASAGSPCPKTKFENPRVVNCSGEAGFLPDTKVVDDTNSVNGVKSTQSAAMQRRIAKERIQALHKATNIAHKRSWTGMLLDIPIADNEPVPEAEGYSSRHPAETQILSCNPRYHDYSIQYAYWQVLRKCHRRIWITTPYYLPSRKLFRALLHTASRGVDVRILAGSSRTTDPWFMWHASRYVTERLIRGGVRIYEYKGNQIMHAKTVVVDSVWSSIGSYNWDIMSDKNLEVCLCHLDAKMAREMETHFLEDLKLSEEVKLEDYQKRSLWLRFTSFFFYNLVYILQRIAFFSFADDDLEASLYSSKIKSKKLLGKKDNLKGEI